MENIIVFLYITATTIQLIYYLLIFSRLAFYNKKEEKKKVLALPTPILTSSNEPLSKPTFQDGIPVSVIICAKNEAHNLQRFLPKILAQDYPVFEVLVVDDASEDDTAMVLANFQRENAHLQILTLRKGAKRDMSGKKFALSKGIQNAKYEALLLTDADCMPSSNAWIGRMVRHLGRKDIEIVLGYSPYETLEKWGLNAMIQYETLWTATQYLSFALIKMPYMGVGRNMAYQKSVFDNNHGFVSHKNVQSGDDDLFINQVANAQNTRIEIASDAFCYSVPPATWGAWYRQKHRHLSAGTHYQAKFKVLLGLIVASHFIFYSTLIATFFLEHCYITTITLFIVRLIVLVILFQKIIQKLNSPLTFWLIPLIDFLYIFYYLILFPTTLLNKHIQWKQTRPSI